MRDELFLIHFSLQIKQNVYSIGTYSASDVTQIIVKMYEKNRKKSHFFKYAISPFICISDTKTSVMRAMVVEYISKKKGWHKIAKLVNRDRK